MRQVKLEPKYAIVVPCNDDESLARNIMASRFVADPDVELHIIRNAVSAAAAYNEGLDLSRAPYVIFVHQDVYLPEQWRRALEARIDSLDSLHPEWGVLAPYGVTLDGEHVGQVWSTSLGELIGRPTAVLEPVQSIDELVIVVRRGSGLRFDDAMPNFHLYGTDLVQAARIRGLGAFVGDLPVVHNDSFHDYLRGDFASAYHFLRRKWFRQLPIRTPVLWVNEFGLGLYLYRLRAWRSIEKRRLKAGDTKANPRIYSERCGWEREYS